MVLKELGGAAADGCCGVGLALLLSTMNGNWLKPDDTDSSEPVDRPSIRLSGGGTVLASKPPCESGEGGRTLMA